MPAQRRSLAAAVSARSYMPKDAIIRSTRLVAARGRAAQMNAGAAVATGDVLLFLHADSWLPADPAEAIASALAAGARWGRFDVTIAGRPAILRVVAWMMNARSRLTGIASWRVKETDRLTAMATELRKLGAVVEEGADYLVVQPPQRWQSASVHTYDDHRIAMSFAMAALRSSGPIEIEDCANVATSFPDFTGLAKRAGLHIAVMEKD